MVNAGDDQISFSPFRLACPFLPTMMWSCTEMPSGVWTIGLIIWMSACEGVGEVAPLQRIDFARYVGRGT